MSDHLRAFVAAFVVISFAVFVTRWAVAGTSIARPFERRYKFYLIAVVLSFAIPNYWLAMLALGVLAVVAARKDGNPVAIFLLLMLAFPHIEREVTKLGPINSLFVLSPIRVLVLSLFLPIAIRMMFKPRLGDRFAGAYRFGDVMAFLLYGYILVMYVPYENVTSLMRRGAHMFTDFLLPYFVISRFCRDRETVRDSAGALLVGGMIMGVAATFEHFKGWLLWDTLPNFWGANQSLSIFLVRDGFLRAAGTAGHQLVLGHFLVVCMGLLGIFRPYMNFNRHLVALLMLAIGLYATVSRGPWLGAAMVALLAGLFTDNVRGYYLKLFGIGSVVIVAILLSPAAPKLMNLLPFVGKVETENVEYRKAIFDTALLLVAQRPLFGSVMIVEQLEHLRQGQGIIDLVNVYAEYAISYGLVGLGIFVLFLCSGIFCALTIGIRTRKRDRDLYVLAGNLGAALFGSMVLLAGLSNYLSVPMVFTTLVALLVALRRGHELAPRQSLTPLKPTNVASAQAM